MAKEMAAIDEAFREGKKAGREQKAMLERSLEAGTRALNKTRTELKRVVGQPHVPQILITVGGVGVGGFTALKLQGMLDEATREWLVPDGEENAGEATFGRKFMVNGFLPITGLGLMGLGLWAFGTKGNVCAGIVGLGAGMLFGSLFGTLMADDEE